MLELNNYRVEAKPKQFEDEKFQNSSDFKEWLLSDSEEDNQGNSPECAGFQIVYSVVQEMFQLRFLAEEYYRHNPYLAKDKRRELPLPLEEILEKETSLEKDKEPPETIISRIAQNKLHIIDSILGNIRKILRRDRELTPLSRVQQVDAHCLSWLIRQPGQTPVQKAGSRQKIMAIVRNESFDTLENRVLKAFLKLCIAYGKRYLLEFQHRFSESDRIKSVRRLCSTAKLALQSKAMTSVSVLKGQPIPNYVLLHDQLYSTIWQMYLNLLYQTNLLENAWKRRPELVQQYCFFKLILSINLDKEFTPVIHSPFFFSADLKNEDLFIKNSAFQEFFLANNTYYKLDLVKNNSSYCGAEITNTGTLSSKQISIVFIPPEYWDEEFILPPQNNHMYVVFGKIKNNSKQKNIMCFTEVSKVFDLMLNGLNRLVGVAR